jgi:hypothetical protein
VTQAQTFIANSFSMIIQMRMTFNVVAHEGKFGAE